MTASVKIHIYVEYLGRDGNYKTLFHWKYKQEHIKSSFLFLSQHQSRCCREFFSHIYLFLKNVLYLLLLLPVSTSVRSDAKTSVIPAFSLTSFTQFSKRMMRKNRGKCVSVQTDKLVNAPLASTHVLTRNDKFYMRYNIKATWRSRGRHDTSASFIMFLCVYLSADKCGDDIEMVNQFYKHWDLLLSDSVKQYVGYRLIFYVFWLRFWNVSVSMGTTATTTSTFFDCRYHDYKCGFSFPVGFRFLEFYIYLYNSPGLNDTNGCT